MTLAGKLACSILNAQSRMGTIAAHSKDELLKQLEEFHSLSNMASKAEPLKQKYSEVTSSLDEAKSRVALLKLQHEQVKANLAALLQETDDRLRAIYATRMQESQCQRVDQEFNDSIKAFSEELQKIGIDTEQAPPAQLLRQFPHLERIATAIRLRAKSQAKAASETLEKDAELRQRVNSLRDAQRELEVDWKILFETLRQHYRPGESGIFNDIETIDPKISKRICQEILAPKLNDAQIEREKGLAASDPLDELRALQ